VARAIALQRTAGNRAVGRVLARRRMFSGTDLFSLLDDARRTGDEAVLSAGFERMWKRAWAYVNDPETPADRAARGFKPADPEDVWFLASTGKTKADFLKAHPVHPFDSSDLVKALADAQSHFIGLPLALRASHLVDALLTVYPELKISDAHIGAVKITSAADKANAETLSKLADSIFGIIADGREDESIKQVFGPKNLAAAKRKYATAHKMMKKLVKSGDISVDRSGYPEEEGTAGATVPGGPIELNPTTLDEPTSHYSVLTMIHESLHAANRDVGDKGYIHSPGFVSAPEALKLTNAAHFEVVPARIIAKGMHVTIPEAFAGQTFVPAAAGGGGTGKTSSDPLKQADDALQMAWNVASMLHTAVYDLLYEDPGMWDYRYKGVAYSDYVPYWSKVEKLTIHERLAHIDPSTHAGWRQAKAPVTEIDLALSEEVVHDIHLARGNLPQTDAEFDKLVAAAKLPAAVVLDRTSTPEKKSDLAIELVCGIKVGSITGTGARDLRVIRTLAETKRDWKKIQKKRPPSDFAD
jgi:hypothetical protein